MARPAADFMMSALARRLGAEDRLTELFACVVAADTDLSRALLDRLGLSDFRVRSVQTQVGTGEGLRTMDMHLSLAAGGTPAGELWCEHKLGCEFGATQLADYEKAMTTRHAQGDDVQLLVFLGRDPKESDARQLASMRARVLMWSDVADVIDSVLAKRDRDWYRTAVRPGAPVELRVLAELAIYMQDNAEVAVSGPLDDDKLSALEHIDAARNVAVALLGRIAERLHPGCADERYAEAEEAWLSLAAIGWWNELEGSLNLWTAPVAWFHDLADPIPSFGVSVHVPIEQQARLEGDRAFVDTLDAASLRLGTYWDDGETIDVASSIPLATVVAHPNLGEQAEELARFAAKTIMRLAECVPAGADPTAPPREQRLIGTLDPESPSWRQRWM